MSTTTPTPHSSTKSRKYIQNSAFVQVPASPFDLERYQPLSTPGASTSRSSNKLLSAHVSIAGTKLKENTPCHFPGSKQKSLAMTSSASASGSTSGKRTIADRDRDNVTDNAPSSSKRMRTLSIASATTPLKPSQLNSPTKKAEVGIEVDLSKACPDFPNGWTYCHQCCKKRDLGATIHCTALEVREVGKAKAVKQKRCVNKFCRPCLKNRYDLDLDVLKSNSKRETGHVDNAGYTFTCPKCSDTCNCPRCRKLKGLEPIGNMLARKHEEQGSSKKVKAKPSKSSVKPSAVDPAADPKKKGRPKAQKKPKTIAPVKWMRIAPSLSQSEIEERVSIREFLLRFNHLSPASMPKAHLDELEQLNGNGKPTHGIDSLDEVAWVSDACVKSAIMALLGLLAVAGDNYKLVDSSQHAIKALRPGGFNLTKVWSVLVDWQNSIQDTTVAVEATSTSRHTSTSSSRLPPSSSASSSLTDLSSSSSADEEEEESLLAEASFALEGPRSLSLSVLTAIDQGRRATRGMTNGSTGASIVSSSQMIPVVLSMIEYILQLGIEALRTEIDEGLQSSKDMTRQIRECVKGEGERWEVVRKEREGDKDKGKSKNKLKFQAAKKLHKDILSALDGAGSIVQTGFIHRYSPLGADPDGRVYYTLAPGIAEREAALEYVDKMLAYREQPSKAKLRLKKKGRTVKGEDRDGLTEWSWMVLVWGQIPDAKEAFCPNLPSNSDDEDEDEDAMDVDGVDKDDPTKPRWYAFTQPEDIRHLAQWLALENGLETEDGSEKEKASAEGVHDGQGPVKRIIAGLNDFAGLLEWRERDDKYRLPDEDLESLPAGVYSANGNSSAKTSAKSKTIPPEQFYSN
ncbi:hypothetical protein FA15DRAFT_278859 [Coprinopsis marcescibilis]|uniref:Zinc-finger domain-containing protein n=1 Tax=Coprinopsis marcescibilis TaxID=230819 RepID=A0A5C3L1E2_COPMA|nr:hypothetical protein FA15DRAFT_278859 [Coprinopsis marcescibilis]